MSDERLRAAERAAGSGELEAQQRVLVERLRAGLVGPARLALAAALGHEAARGLATSTLALPDVRAAWRLGPLRLGRRRELEDFERWLLAVTVDREASFQAAAAAVTTLAPRWTELDLRLGQLHEVLHAPPERAQRLAVGLCTDLVLRPRDDAADPVARLQARIREHLLAWAVGALERPALQRPFMHDPACVDASPIFKLAVRLLEDALGRGAERVVIEPREGGAGTVVSHEAQGATVERMDLPARATPPLIAALLFMADVDPLPGGPARRGRIELERLSRQGASFGVSYDGGGRCELSARLDAGSPRGGGR